jgi:Na+/melibiose symporter-like transporter
MVVPRTPGSFPLILALNLLLFFTFSGLGVASPAALADIVDFGRLRVRRGHGRDVLRVLHDDREGLDRSSRAASDLRLAGAFGFEAQTATHSAASTSGFMLAFSIVPAALTLTCAAADSRPADSIAGATR